MKELLLKKINYLYNTKNNLDGTLIKINNERFTINEIAGNYLFDEGEKLEVYSLDTEKTFTFWLESDYSGYNY